MTSKNPTDTHHAEPTLREILPKPMDWKVVSICCLCALILTASKYYGNTGALMRVVSSLAHYSDAVADFKAWLLELFFRKDHPRGRLWQLHYWAGFHTVLYFVIPALVVKLCFRERLRDYGLKITGWYSKLWVYAAAFAVVLPAVFFVRGSAAFQKAYPFYKHAGDSWADFLGWECVYILQFFALEFFFRGFLLHGLKHRFGYYSVFVMTVPYCMIHFGKPLPETIGAIIAGVFLGTLSLWTRSIWLGVLIHVSVAVTMDLAALQFRGELGNLFGI